MELKEIRNWFYFFRHEDTTSLDRIIFARYIHPGSDDLTSLARIVEICQVMIEICEEEMPENRYELISCISKSLILIREGGGE